MSDARAPVPAGLLVGLEARYGAEAVAAQLASLTRHGDAVDDPARWLELAVAKRFKPTGLEVVPRCACGSRELERLGWFEFWNLLGLARCRVCGTVVVTPRLDAPSVKRIFEETYFAEEGADPRFWGRRRMPVFEEVHRLLGRYGVRRVFDVGCAYGHLLSYLRDRGMAVAGCDVSPEVVAWGRRELHLDLQVGSVRAVDAPAETFDAVVCLDTLYYATDPVADLKAMRRLLRPDGVLLLRLRNGLLGRLRTADAARGLVYPPMSVEHLWGFTPRSIRPVLRRGEFAVEAVLPAAYSETRFRTVTAAWRMACGVLTGLSGGLVPPLTQSFNVLARPAEVMVRTPAGERARGRA